MSNNFEGEIIKNNYNPLQFMEKTKNIDEIEWDRMNLYNYFAKFSEFISPTSSTSSQMESVKLFTQSLCKLYIGHTIHLRINNEISNKTNLLILKGDYFFTYGYYSVTKLGNPFLVKVYSKIAENFAKV